MVEIDGLVVAEPAQNGGSTGAFACSRRARRTEKEAGPANGERPGDLTTHRAILLVLFVSLSAYANSLGNGFAYDDTQIVAGNPVVTTPLLGEALFGPYWAGVREGAGLYRPVVVTSFALESTWPSSTAAAGSSRGRARIAALGQAPASSRDWGRLADIYQAMGRPEEAAEARRRQSASGAS